MKLDVDGTPGHFQDRDGLVGKLVVSGLAVAGLRRPFERNSALHVAAPERGGQRLGQRGLDRGQLVRVLQGEVEIAMFDRAKLDRQ